MSLNEGTKALIASKTIWGASVAILSGIAGILGYSIDEETKKSLMELLPAIASVVGGLWAFYGRIRARKVIR